MRTLLLAITLAGLWLGWQVHLARVQDESVKAIQEYGGWVRYDFQFPSGEFHHSNFDPKANSPVPLWLLQRVGIDFFHDVVQVNLNYSTDSGSREENDNPTDEALQHLSGFPKLRVLLLSNTQATDASMRHMAALKKLERLYMWDVSNVSDDGVQHLAELKELRYILLDHSQITDEAMRVFATLPKLEGLSLQANRFSNNALRYISSSMHLRTLLIGLGDITVNDDGLVHLANLTQLEHLGIRGSHVTSSGVVHLEPLRKLKTLWIDESAVAGPELEELKAKMPNLKVQ